MRVCSSSLAVLLSAASFVVAGCGRGDGPDLGTVSGKITLDGRPVEKAVITFIPETGGSPSYGASNASGEYLMQFTGDKKGASVGKHKVTIEGGNPSQDENGKPLPDQQITKVPKKYQKGDELSAEVKAGANVIDFALDSK